MAGNELGTVTHRYWYGSDVYFRQPLNDKRIGAIEFWNGEAWERVLKPLDQRLQLTGLLNQPLGEPAVATFGSGYKAALPNQSLPNPVSLAHTG